MDTCILSLTMDISSSAKMANHALLPMSFENNNVLFGEKKSNIFQALSHKLQNSRIKIKHTSSSNFMKVLLADGSC